MRPRYRPQGAAAQLMRRREPELVISGPAGTGKSRACLEKLHDCACRWPGMRGLMVRKTRASLTEAAMVTFEEQVLWEHARQLLAAGIQRRVRQGYRYPNGSSIVVGGMDNAAKVMSTEFDLIYVQEATELALDDWEALTTRLRHGTMPFQQILGDCNPGAPSHWLKRRADQGLLVMLQSRHEDNPAVTPAYLSRLDRLTGALRERLRFGRWVGAEGAVYPEWDPARHLIDPVPIPTDWPRIWSVDFGYTHPFVWQAWAADGDGRLYRYREIYRTGGLVEDHAAAIRALTAGEPHPKAILCDHDAEDRATLRRHLGGPMMAAYKGVAPGIRAVAARLRLQGDGRPRLFLLRNALAERDETLRERRLPTCTEEEIEGYVWETGAAGLPAEAPRKLHDHGCDALRYAVAYADRVGRARVMIW